MKNRPTLESRRGNRSSGDSIARPTLAERRDSVKALSLADILAVLDAPAPKQPDAAAVYAERRS